MEIVIALAVGVMFGSGIWLILFPILPKEKHWNFLPEHQLARRPLHCLSMTARWNLQILA